MTLSLSTHTHKQMHTRTRTFVSSSLPLSPSLGNTRVYFHLEIHRVFSAFLLTVPLGPLLLLDIPFPPTQAELRVAAWSILSCLVSPSAEVTRRMLLGGWPEAGTAACSCALAEKKQPAAVRAAAIRWLSVAMAAEGSRALLGAGAGHSRAGPDTPSTPPDRPRKEQRRGLEGGVGVLAGAPAAAAAAVAGGDADADAPSGGGDGDGDGEDNELMPDAPREGEEEEEGGQRGNPWERGGLRSSAALQDWHGRLRAALHDEPSGGASNPMAQVQIPPLLSGGSWAVALT